ncbi:Leucine-rich repeat-containing protein LOC400891-like [Durusdinium trenchii]|uniref:Leucine-rich repeat-containing protein LOC400891-like n=1 Tax=Durusdinium trenchii TaxID=1381693 RepID=A0ABP0SKX5_9DINO
MDYAAHALHVALQEQMAQEIKAREYEALIRSTAEDRFYGPREFRPKHFPQDFPFRSTLRRSWSSGKTLQRPRSARTQAPQENRFPWLQAERLRAARRVARTRYPRGEEGPVKRRTASPARKVEKVAGRAAPSSLRCRLLGHTELAAVSVPGWQAAFEFELRMYLAQLLGRSPDELRVRARNRKQRVSVHLSLEAVPKDAETLKESLYDGSLRRLAIRNCTGLESPWPNSQALRQFLLREINFDAFWVVERHEWHIPNFHQALNQRPYAMLASESFDLGGGTNLSLHLHPAGIPHGGGQTGACLTLSAAGHGLPSFPFILSAGTGSEIWAGPYGRDSSNRFLSGGPLCSTEELRQLDANCLVLAVEAVQRKVPEVDNTATTEAEQVDGPPEDIATEEKLAVEEALNVLWPALTGFLPVRKLWKLGAMSNLERARWRAPSCSVLWRKLHVGWSRWQLPWPRNHGTSWRRWSLPRTAECRIWPSR